MAKLKWDEVGKKFYEDGVSRGVLYVQSAEGVYGTGVAWNGLVSVTEKPSGAEPQVLYANNGVYAELRGAEKFGATIEAFTYPVEFEACDGSSALSETAAGIIVGQQTRLKFGLCYRTEIGNDATSDYGYKIHLVYGCSASPSEKAHKTRGENPEAATMSWEANGSPVEVPGKKPTCHVTIDSKLVGPETMKKIEDKLYGTDADGVSTFLTPAELIALVSPGKAAAASVGNK